MIRNSSAFVCSCNSHRANGLSSSSMYKLEPSPVGSGHLADQGKPKGHNLVSSQHVPGNTFCSISFEDWIPHLLRKTIPSDLPYMPRTSAVVNLDIS